ncbi:TolC family protein [Massilia sp. H6]|uniref:TolC family protein n=1 Tax=Massilia sp. H6 TaxID=2970464 RepID=UPI002167FA44|nr:TolC family protein [Massilia sp. H6]UVW30054.1 TolC family protein [Massilia sp. H6]
MKKSCRLPLLVLAALALGGPSLAQAAGDPVLSLQAAQQRAVDRSRQLVAKDHAASAARDRAVVAGQLPDPVLKFGIESLPVDGPQRWSLGGDFMTMRRIAVMQELPRAEKRQLQSQRFEREAELAGVEKTAVAAVIARDTALAWLERFYTERMAALIAEQVTLAAEEIKAVEAGYRGGRNKQAEVLGAHASLALLEDRASDIRGRVRAATIALERWIGASAHLPLGAAPDMAAIPFDLARLETQVQRLPELAILDKQIEVAALETGLARANRKADWSVELAFLQRGSNYSNMVSVGLSLPLQWNRGKRQDRELAARHAQLDGLGAERDDALRAQVAAVQDLANEWTTYRERLARFETVLVPLARSRVDAEMAAYRGGASRLDAVLAASRGATDARLQAVQLELEAARLWAQLAYLVPATRKEGR